MRWLTSGTCLLCLLVASSGIIYWVACPLLGALKFWLVFIEINTRLPNCVCLQAACHVSGTTLHSFAGFSQGSNKLPRQVRPSPRLLCYS